MNTCLIVLKYVMKMLPPNETSSTKDGDRNWGLRCHFGGIIKDDAQGARLKRGVMPFTYVCITGRLVRVSGYFFSRLPRKSHRREAPEISYVLIFKARTATYGQPLAMTPSHFKQTGYHPLTSSVTQYPSSECIVTYILLPGRMSNIHSFPKPERVNKQGGVLGVHADASCISIRVVC